MSARRHLGEILSAFEFLDRQALAVTLEQLPNVVQDPLPDTEARGFMLDPEYEFARRMRICFEAFHADKQISRRS